MKILLILLWFFQGEAHLYQGWYDNLEICAEKGNAKIEEQLAKYPGMKGIYADCIPVDLDAI